MKVLEVIHDFLPRHQAGSELYCYHISKQLQKSGHDVRLFYTEIDHSRPQYSVRTGEYDGLPFWEIVNNHTYRHFQETYDNPTLENVFAEVLDVFCPDCVQFHHIMSLSYGCVRLCKERGMPVVFTLHDYWLTCPRGGQRYKGNGSVCEVHRFQSCAECISRYSIPSGRLTRLCKKVLQIFEKIDPPTLIHAMQHGKIDVPDRTFVYADSLVIEGERKETLIAHPPCRISFIRDIPAQSELVFSTAMAPDTYEKEGNGVLFAVYCDGDLLFEQTLDAKNNPGDRGWKNHVLPLDVHPGRHTLTFVTRPFPGDDFDYCSAGWGDLKIISTVEEEYTPSVTSNVRAWGERWLSKFQSKRLDAMMKRRTRMTQEMFSFADLFIAPSKFLRDTFIQYGLPEHKIIFSDYGIETSRFQFSRKVFANPLRFSYIGTFVEHKGVHVLIEAFNQLPEGVAVLNLYGDLTEYSGYVKRIQSMITHPGINLRGRAENADVPTLLAETDVLVVPSIWYENSPITIHEAFLASVPVITSKFGGMQNLVQHEKNGLLYEVGNAEALHTCLWRCVEEEGLLETIVPNPQSVKTIEIDAKWTESVLQALLSNKPIPAPPDA
jgi:glycosyltransferase involved in cell wall biosynthesis